MDPPSENLEANDFAGLEADLWLKIRHELAVIEAVADALLDLALGDERALHACVKPHRASNAAASRVVHRDVAAAKDIGDARRTARCRSDAGKGPDLDDPLLEHERAGCRAQHAFGHAFGARAVLGTKR